MKVFAIVPSDRLEVGGGGSTAGILARSEVRCVCLKPEAELVDRLALQEPPDLLIVDTDTPGFAALHAIRSLRKFTEYMLVPIVAISERDWSAEAKAAGASLFLRKPLNPQELEDAVAKFVKPVTRKAPRKGLRGPCVVSKGGVKIEGRICDVSIGGAQVTLPDKLPIGAMVRLGFAVILQKTPHIIQCNARVVRAVPGGYGLAFCQLDVTSRSLLQAFAKT